MLGLLELALIPDQSLMLLVLAFTKHHGAACDIFVCIFSCLVSQLGQLDAIVIILLAVLLPLLGEIEEHLVVHVDVLHLRLEVGEDFAVLLDNFLVREHVSLDSVVVSGQLGAVGVEGGEAISQLLRVQHGDLVVHENTLDVRKLTLHLLHLAGNEGLSSFDHVIIVHLLLSHFQSFSFCPLSSDCAIFFQSIN